MKTNKAWIAELSGLLWVLGSLAALPAFASEQPPQPQQKQGRSQAQAAAGAQTHRPATGLAQFPRGAR